MASTTNAYLQEDVSMMVGPIVLLAVPQLRGSDPGEVYVRHGSIVMLLVICCFMAAGFASMTIDSNPLLRPVSYIEAS